MNKIFNSNNDYEMLDDYSEILHKNWSKVVRGKHYHRYPKDKQSVVKIIGSDGVRYVKMLTAQLDSDIPPGEYQTTLIIEELTNPPTLEATDEINGEEENIEHSA